MNRIKRLHRDRIGYLVPEFPGQTHIMFWREINELRSTGMEVDLVSTRMPMRVLMPHDWSDEASAQTTYLFPLSGKALGNALVRGASAGPASWFHVAKAFTASERTTQERRRLLGAAVLGARLAAYSRQRGWRHLHVHSCAFSADIARFARLLGGCSFSVTLHGPLVDYGPDQSAKWSSASFAIVITNKLDREVRVELAGHLPERIAISSMGVTLTRLHRAAPYQPWMRNGCLQVFSCGRLNPSKGHSDLIQAIALLRSQGLPVKCVIAGEDESGGQGYRATLRAEIARFGLEDAVHLLGAVSEDEVIRNLHTAHMFALASLEEPLGIAIMEAMGAGVPVVATAAGGVPDLILNGKDGLLVSPRAPSALAAALQRIAEDSELAISLSRAAATTASVRSRAPSSAEILIGLMADTRPQPEWAE